MAQWILIFEHELFLRGINYLVQITNAYDPNWKMHSAHFKSHKANAPLVKSSKIFQDLVEASNN